MLERMVLRAELVHDGRCIVGHTTEIGASSVFVRTDEPVAVGSEVQLRLSFPRLFAPLELAATVRAHDAGSGHGYFAGVMLDFPAEDRLAELQRRPGDAPATGSCRILLVEDSAVMRDVVAQSASSFSRTFRIETATAESAEAALELVQRTTFDLAILDLYLASPLTGADLVRDLRARQLDVPVIGFSVGGSKARLAFLEAGADMFLDKPIMLRDVFTTLERLLATTRRPPT